MAREIGMQELSKIINEEVAKVDDELEKVDAEEVDADEYADTLAQKIDYEKANKINPSVNGAKMQEQKAIRLAMALRKKRIALEEQAERKKMKLENSRLRATLKKLKGIK